ncbi:hypothetical protein [Gloeobacter kilaueensis]|uniref:Uncharacterized protein n=1 Tax=Gloeobacter kilaueensis (strain ATCC BAA-2537 / CCAP 1431/1 / ULC 316 / JS1) TaxID=1183438 RepID=U5QLU8_GLOK1|nr:hypothetical protein [Gloeobacter kilaueensis]AGY59881.1 hypothetical protein GKIL_3635 [Gloeobacter kilaueensis JS1]
MFALVEILDEPWARAALSEQFNVWRGTEGEWQLYLPGPWPVHSWQQAPTSELVVEGTETIRALIGGEDWRAFTAQTAPLFALIQNFPKLGHWDEEEEIEPFVPLLQAGIELLHLTPEHFEIDAAGTMQFRPVGLVELPDPQVQQFLEKRPRTWKARPPRGSGWSASWQVLWSWIEAARSFWGTHFVNPVASLAQPYAGLPVQQLPAQPAVTHTVTTGPLPLKAFLDRCSGQQLRGQLRLHLEAGTWQAQLVVQYPAGQIEPAQPIERVVQLAREVGLEEGHWQGGWTLERTATGGEGWFYEVRSAPLPVPALSHALQLEL